MTLLGEVADFEMGQAPPGTECNMDGIGKLFVKAGEFGKPYPIEREWTTKPLKLGRRGDVFICVVGATAGKLNLGIDCAIGRSVAAIRPSARIDTKFLYYQLQPWVLKLRAASAGSAQGVISKKQLAEIPIELPEVDEQRRVVGEIEKQFSRLDEAVANLHRVKANLKRYKSGVLKAAVEGRLVTQSHVQGNASAAHLDAALLRAQILDARYESWVANSTRIARYKSPAEPKADRLGALPTGWTWTTIEELGLAERPCAYGVLQPGDDRDAGIPLVRVGDINEGRVDTAGLKRIEPAIAARYPRTQLRGGELLITLVGSIGRTAIVPAELKGANVARAVGVVPLSSNVNPRWVEIWFRSPDQLRSMDGQAHEVARKTLNLEDVRQAVVALPPLEVQRRIVDEVDARLTITEAVERDTDKAFVHAARLRASVLASAFGDTNRLADA